MASAALSTLFGPKSTSPGLQHQLPDAGPLDSLPRRHYLDRTALLLQSGERPVHEGTRSHNQGQSDARADDARPDVVPHVRGADRTGRLGLLGKHRGRRRAQRRRLRRSGHGKLLFDLDDCLGSALRLPYPGKEFSTTEHSLAWSMPSCRGRSLAVLELEQPRVGE